MTGAGGNRPRRVIGPRARSSGWRQAATRLSSAMVEAMRRAAVRLAAFRLPAVQLPNLRLRDRPGGGGGSTWGSRIPWPSWLAPKMPTRLGSGRPGEPLRPAGSATSPDDDEWDRADRGGGGRPLGRGRLLATRRPIGARDPADEGAGEASATAEMLVLSISLVAISRIAEGPALWACAVLTFTAHVLAALEVLGGDAEAAGVASDEGIPVEALLTPGLAALAAIGAMRLVPIGLGLVPGLALAGVLVAASLSVERRILVRPAGPTDSDRLALLSLLLLIAFLGFSGIAAAIPGALAAHVSTETPAAALTLQAVTVLAVADGLVAGLAGYRLAAVRSPSLRGAAITAVTYALVVAIAAAALRALVITGLLGPALLALVMYLWSAYRGAPRTGRRDRRWIWELALLTGLGALFIVWNLLAQG